MPRFFFDLEDNGSLSSDEEGFECRSLSSAKAEAVKTLAEMTKDALPGTDNRTLAIKVRDKSRRLVLKAEVKFEVDEVAVKVVEQSR